jgi:catechol 2,3-dioxygenase-like lactoylglutathione lyase family enzyme
MPKPTRIAETALYVDDLPRALRFYTALFTCPVLRQDERLCALRIADEQVLLLFQRGASTQPSPIDGGIIPAHDGQGPLHVCFGIEAGELTQWEQRLSSLGIVVESRVRWPGGGMSLYFRDPDHHAVELATPGLWSGGSGTK